MVWRLPTTRTTEHFAVPGKKINSRENGASARPGKGPAIETAGLELEIRS
jgi:hypothetical protein